MTKKRKAKTIATKRLRAQGRLSSSRKKEDKSDIGDDIDPDQADDKYLLSL